MKKCQFFQTSLKILGHMVSIAGVQVYAEKTLVVQAFLTPRNLKELQSFLGMAGPYYHECGGTHITKLHLPSNGETVKVF